MELDVETLDDLNLVDCPPEVNEGYKRRRADLVQYDKYAQDYDRTYTMNAWAQNLVSKVLGPRCAIHMSQ